MGKNGTDVMLWANTAAPPLLTYEVVGSQRDVTFNETTAEIDVSNKNDGRAFRGEPGRYKATFTFDQVYVPTDAAYLALRDAMRNGDKILVMRDYEGTPAETADAIITSLSEKMPDQDAAIVSIGGTIDGEWTEVGT